MLIRRKLHPLAAALEAAATSAHSSPLNALRCRPLLAIEYARTEKIVDQLPSECAFIMRFLISVAEVNRGSSAKRSLASRSDAPIFTAAKLEFVETGGERSHCRRQLRGADRIHAGLRSRSWSRSRAGAGVAFGRKAQFTFLNRLDVTATTWSGRKKLQT